MNVEITKVNEDDFDFIEKLTKKIVSEKYFSPRQNKVNKTYLKSRINTSRTEMYVAYIDNNSAGYIDADIREDGTCYIARLAIDEKFRGKGIGHKLLCHIENIAKNNKCHKIVLETLVECKNAQCLYMKNDFYPEGLLRNDGYKCDFIVMGKFI